MEIIIPLPQSYSTNTYQELKASLKQLELAIHHAQKSVESAEKEGVEISEDCFIEFQHQAFNSSLQLDAKSNEYDDKEKAILNSICDNYYDELNNVSLRINLA